MDYDIEDEIDGQATDAPEIVEDQPDDPVALKIKRAD
jgi:hypothetical protein